MAGLIKEKRAPAELPGRHVFIVILWVATVANIYIYLIITSIESHRMRHEQIDPFFEVEIVLQTSKSAEKYANHNLEGEVVILLMAEILHHLGWC